MSPPPILRAAGLARRDPRETNRWFFRGLSLDLLPHEIALLQGPTGSGKTLLLRGLAGLDPLDDGQVELLGKPSPEWEAPVWRSAALYLHQVPALPPGTVETALREPFAYRVRRNRPFPRRRALDLLQALGREGDFLSDHTEDLSGGERQLVALVRGLLADPHVLLLDEPTAALDPEATALAERLLRHWIADGEGAGGPRAVLWVTHDSEQAGRVGSRRLRLSGGTVEAWA